MDINNTQVMSYRHIRNKKCIYQRVGDSSEFKWENYTRDESGIAAEIHYNEKFEVFEVKNLITGEIKQIV